MSAMTLVVNGDPYVLDSTEQNAVMDIVERAFERGGGWVEVGNSAFFMTPTTQVSMVPAKSHVPVKFR